MHQTRKGNEWHFGMKAHVGMDADTKLVHTVEAAANVADSKVLPALLHGTGCGATRLTRATPRCRPNMRSKVQVWPEQREKNRLYSKVRSRVEHVFGVLKLRLGFSKVRYRGLAKNLQRLQISFALVNLVTAQKHLAVLGQHCARRS